MKKVGATFLKKNEYTAARVGGLFRRSKTPQVMAGRVGLGRLGAENLCSNRHGCQGPQLHNIVNSSSVHYLSFNMLTEK